LLSDRQHQSSVREAWIYLVRHPLVVRERERPALSALRGRTVDRPGRHRESSLLSQRYPDRRGLSRTRTHRTAPRRRRRRV